MESYAVVVDVIDPPSAVRIRAEAMAARALLN